MAARDDSFDSFTYMEVADFTEAQIETFVKKWFVKEPIKCEKFLTDFEQQEHSNLKELASSPLLLGMLCLAFADTMKFTTKRATLYADAIDALLRKWDSSRSISRDDIYTGFDHEVKQRLFRTIAYHTFLSHQYLIKEQDLIKQIDLCLTKFPNPEKKKLDGEFVLKKIMEQNQQFPSN